MAINFWLTIWNLRCGILEKDIDISDKKISESVRRHHQGKERRLREGFGKSVAGY